MFQDVRTALWRVVSKGFLPEGLGPKQFAVLRSIAAHGGANQCDLARDTSTDPSALSRTILALEGLGWVVRKRDLEDKRRFVVVLTKVGRRVVDRIERDYDDAATILGKALTDGDVEALGTILAKLRRLEETRATQRAAPKSGRKKALRSGRKAARATA